eukprot:TRINITY_DN15001_c0_g1_i2.p1 TRINITY_DN15001_c0_g1~~TRINITY_DN15001_c0_g1_i2.p1  ORF type:complete len:140 (+),score=34.12 TRINITY_DN15001_c0_g1_i2:95-514(+)
MESLKTAWYQKEIALAAKGRGCHYITDEIVSAVSTQLAPIKIGLCNLSLKHNSASIALGESYDPSVLADMETVLSRVVPESGGKQGGEYVKNGLVGTSHTIPVTDGQLNMGKWQGIWLCEHQSKSEPKNLVITLSGQLK